jgi:hypothetical protein
MPETGEPQGALFRRPGMGPGEKAAMRGGTLSLPAVLTRNLWHVLKDKAMVTSTPSAGRSGD